MFDMKVFIKYLIGTFKTAIYCKRKFDKYLKIKKFKKNVKENNNDIQNIYFKKIPSVGKRR